MLAKASVFTLTMLCAFFANATDRDSTILDIRVFDSSNMRPLPATITLFLNSDFIVHDSINASSGNFARMLEGPGFYIMDVFAENYLGCSDTLWVVDEKKQIIERRYFVDAIEPGYTINLNNIHFYFNSIYLKPGAQDQIDSVATFLHSHPGVEIEIAGHTDDEGPDDFNMTLSEGRARSILKYLINQGIAPERLIAKGYGESMPADRGITKGAKKRNRRVEFIVRAVPVLEIE
jgi:OmpA-OmpF porin, OOP family